MDDQLEQTLKKVAVYIEHTQTQIDDQNEKRSQFLKRANQVAGVLANKGIIARDAINGFTDKIAEDEAQVWDLVEKLADALSVDELGSAVSEKLASADDLDAFERLYYHGDARAEITSPGMVD